MNTNKYIAFIQSENKRILQVSSHFFLIVLAWLLGKYVFIGPHSNDNLFVTNGLCLLYFIETITIYYFFSIYVFPRYLYKLKPIPLLICILVSFWLVSLINYAAIQFLLPYSEGFQPSSLRKDIWIQRLYLLYSKEFSLFACFTNLRLAYWTYGFSFEVATIFLSVKVFRDILAIQKRNLTLENDKLALERDKLALERDNLALELDFLKSQINPHFLFNTLNSIYTRTVDVDEQASDLVLKLSDLMRYSLYGVNEDKVLLKDEIEYIQNYLDLEKYRHNPNLVDISFAIDGPTENLKIVPLLLISLVENAFKHGVNLSRKSSYVHISAVIENGTLYFTVQNSMPDQVRALSASAAGKKSGGIGLMNTRKRLNLLYPNRHQLTFQQTDDEYEAMVSVELNAA